MPVHDPHFSLKNDPRTSFFKERKPPHSVGEMYRGMPLGGVGLGQGVGAQKTRTPGGNWFFSDFLIIFDVAFFCVKI